PTCSLPCAHVQAPQPDRPPRARHRPPPLRPLARGRRDHRLEHRGRRRLHARRLRQGLLRRAHRGRARVALPRPRLPHSRPTAGSTTARSWPSRGRSSRSARRSTRPSRDNVAPLGRAALLVALGCLTYAALAGTYAAVHRRRRLALSARNALVAAFGATAVA